MAKKQQAPKPVAAPRPPWQAEIAARSIADAVAVLNGRPQKP